MFSRLSIALKGVREGGIQRSILTNINYNTLFFPNRGCKLFSSNKDTFNKQHLDKPLISSIKDSSLCKVTSKNTSRSDLVCSCHIDHSQCKKESNHDCICHIDPSQCKRESNHDCICHINRFKCRTVCM
jgi:hypothetical protein